MNYAFMFKNIYFSLFQTWMFFLFLCEKHKNTKVIMKYINWLFLLWKWKESKKKYKNIFQNILCFTEERNEYSFENTWGWVNNDRVFNLSSPRGTQKTFWRMLVTK